MTAKQLSEVCLYYREEDHEFTPEEVELIGATHVYNDTMYLGYCVDFYNQFVKPVEPYREILKKLGIQIESTVDSDYDMASIRSIHPLMFTVKITFDTTSKNIKAFDLHDMYIPNGNPDILDEVMGELDKITFAMDVVERLK